MSLNLELADETVSSRSRAKPLLAAAREACEQGRTVVSQLLAFGQRQSLSPTHFDVNTAITETIEVLRRTLEASITIDAGLAQNLWAVFADRSQFETAVVNLAINARDAMPAGGRLTIATENVVLTEAYAKQHPEVAPGDYVMVTVGDTGSGMSEEVLARAFEPFFTTKPPGEATGLGLSQIHGYVSQSGGHIRISSELGHGTTAMLYLPRGEEPVRRTEAAPPPQVVKGGETILMVEDVAIVRATVRRLLVGLGYEVIEAKTAAEAIARLEGSRHIDLLFTDMVLADGIGGAELAAAARRLRPDLRILLTSGYTQSPIAAGGDPSIGFIAKPYTRQALAERLEEVLSHPADR